ncbi:hypothetical protein SS50377_23261 [Spironucleus salmonicida]|uniref:Uncharacterized protein n=1 Tax=Spironucleus salmonicida TaxID=348837 RepID=V6LIC1_9EUKA|nr:hypothetical protein SS50377_23261 [Spironucleus salmonicida]|eukprot:EST44063.1 Hypothetical protein SS50377_16129 [Spironucleus salmonicida]
MNRIAIVTNDGTLALFEFNFPNLIQILATQISSSSLFNIKFHGQKFVISDKKTIQVYNQNKQQYEYPVDAVSSLASINNFLIISSPSQTFIYDQENAFTTTDSSILVRIIQNVPILADNKNFMIYQLPDKILSKVNYQKHLGEYLVDYDLINNNLLVIGQRKIIKLSSQQDEIIQSFVLENEKIICYCKFKNLIYIGCESGKIIQLSLELQVLRKSGVSNQRIKSLKQFGDFIVYATTSGKIGVLSIDEDDTILRISEIDIKRRINDLDICGGCYIQEEGCGEGEE